MQVEYSFRLKMQLYCKACTFFNISFNTYIHGFSMQAHNMKCKSPSQFLHEIYVSEFLSNNMYGVCTGCILVPRESAECIRWRGRKQRCLCVMNVGGDYNASVISRPLGQGQTSL